jgi:hypothetical protein
MAEPLSKSQGIYQYWCKLQQKSFFSVAPGANVKNILRPQFTNVCKKA